MRISTRGRYSLEALLYLGILKAEGFASTRSISEGTGVSEGYLEQLFIPLRAQHILMGIRGSRGGYFLAKPPSSITVGEILRAVEGPMEIVECMNSSVCSKVDRCQSRHTWKELYDEINNTIDSLTLADLVKSYKNQNGGDYAI